MVHEKIESLCKALKLPIGYLLHGGFVVSCAGNVDSEGNRTDRHVICTLTGGPDTVHAIGNDEFTDDCAIFADGFDPNNPVCPTCGKEPIL